MNEIYYLFSPTDISGELYNRIYSFMPSERKEKYSKGIKTYRYEGVACYALLMLALDKRGISCSDIAFSYAESGKPYSDRLFFNFSHCNECAVCAVGDKDIGVDVQKKDNASQAVIGRYCTDGEKKLIEQGMPFRRLWTQKEAILKLSGKGIGGLEELSDLSEYNNDGEYYNTPYGWLITQMQDGCALSVCSENKESVFIQVTVRQLEEFINGLT